MDRFKRYITGQKGSLAVPQLQVVTHIHVGWSNQAKSWR